MTHACSRCFRMERSCSSSVRVGLSCPRSTRCSRAIASCSKSSPAGQSRCSGFVPDNSAAESADPSAGARRVAARVLEMLPSWRCPARARPESSRRARRASRCSRAIASCSRSSPAVQNRSSGSRRTTRRRVRSRPRRRRQRPPRTARRRRGPTLPLSARDLPVIMRALAEMSCRRVSRSPKPDRTFLRAAVAADLRPAVVDQIQRVLAPASRGAAARGAGRGDSDVSRPIGTVHREPSGRGAAGASRHAHGRSTVTRSPTFGFFSES